RAGRAVRELVAAADRDPDRPDVPARGDRGRLAHWRRQQRLHADQLSRARRSCLQELDPQRRVRAPARGRRRAEAHGDSRCVPDPAEAGADDVGGIHHGRRPAGAGDGPWLRDSARDGRGGVRRDARRHGVRPVPHPRLLRRHPGSGRAAVADVAGCGVSGACSGGGSLIVRALPSRFIRRNLRALVPAAVLTLSGAACVAHTTPPAAAIHPAPLTRWDASVFSDQPYDPLWWRQLDDPVLVQLEDAALAANHDVRIAVARVDEARAVFDEQRRDQYPKVTVGAYVDVRDQQIPGFVDKPIKVNTYPAAFGASWELDVFGRVRAAVAAASANAESFDADLQAVRVSVAADVARNYFELRGLQQRLSVVDRSLVNQRETLRLTTLRRDAGIGEEQDVASASARVAAIEAERPPLRVALAAREHRLAVLTGKQPGQLAIALAQRSDPPLAKAISLGPADQLRNRRPDVRAAERRLAVSAAQEGVAM